MISRLVSWAIDEVGIHKEALATCMVKYTGILTLPAPNARAVLHMFGQLGLSQEECRMLLLKRPHIMLNLFFLFVFNPKK